MANPELISKTWQISGVFGSVVPGVLAWKNGRVSYITEEGIQFNVMLQEIKEIKWPFLTMGLGFDAVVNGKKFKFSFSKPNSSVPEIDIIHGNPLPRVVYAGQFYDPVSSLINFKKDKATTKMWREILNGK